MNQDIPHNISDLARILIVIDFNNHSTGSSQLIKSFIIQLVANTSISYAVALTFIFPFEEYLLWADLDRRKSRNFDV